MPVAPVRSEPEYIASNTEYDCVSNEKAKRTSDKLRAIPPMAFTLEPVMTLSV